MGLRWCGRDVVWMQHAASKWRFRDVEVNVETNGRIQGDMKTFTSGSAAAQLRKMNTELKICWNCTWEADEAVILRCLIVVSSVAQKYRGWLGPRTMEEPVYFNIIQGCFAVIFAIAPRRRERCQVSKPGARCILFVTLEVSLYYNRHNRPISNSKRMQPHSY